MLTISATVRELADALQRHIAAKQPESPLLDLLSKIRTMPEWTSRRDLGAWDTLVCEHEPSCFDLEETDDLASNLVVETFEFGRLNLYAAIQPGTTEQEYQRVTALFERAGIRDIPLVRDCDFTKW